MSCALAQSDSSAIVIALLVGGAVRDRLLGLPVSDQDYVVIGSSPEQMIAAGYLPVGKDFPVFIDPVSKSEYALARTERKVAAGYRGFAFSADPSVTIEQDLMRRDLTINAMAQAPNGSIIDPYGGQQDLHNKVLRHVSEAFAEDPVRILRLSRFAARLTDFKVAPETMQLMQNMVANGEVDALVAERVWQELARGLCEKQPSAMFAVLRDCGALQTIAPELILNTDVLATIDLAAQCDATTPKKLALIFTCLTKKTVLLEALCKRLRVPSDCVDLAMMLQRERTVVDQVRTLSPENLVRHFERCDAFRKPDRFALMLRALSLEVRQPNDLLDNLALLESTRAATSMVRAGDIAAAVTMNSTSSGGSVASPTNQANEQDNNQVIKRAIFDARVSAVETLLKNRKK